MKLISELSKENAKYPFAILKAPKALDSCWPTSSQERILRIALSGPEIAKREWREWNAQHSLEHDQIDIGSYRLLPLVYKNLLRSDITAPNLNILEGLYIIAVYPEYLSLIARRCSQEITTIVTIINTV
jgi:hypothetical protein